MHAGKPTTTLVVDKALPPDSTAKMLQYDMTAYRWVLVGLDLSYLCLGSAAAKENLYPASRHRVSRASKACVAVHIVLGALVIYGGPAIFTLDNQHINFTNCDWVLRTIAVAGVLHSYTVPGMLSKVPGCRKVTVPYYVGVTTINFFNAIRVLYAPSVQYLMLLWGSLSAFVYVRIFVFVFHVVSGGADYMVIYTLAMGLAGYFATIANGLNGLSLLLIASPAVVAPFMVDYSRWYHKTFAECLPVEDATIPAKKTSRQHTILHAICNGVHAALDPADMPHKAAYKGGWYSSLILWFAMKDQSDLMLDVVDEAKPNYLVHPLPTNMQSCSTT